MKEFIHLETGWNDKEFAKILMSKIKLYEENGWEYFDIKISSNGNNCLVILNKIISKRG